MISKELRKFVYKKFNGHCAYCGREIEYNQMQVDHIIPKRNFEQNIVNRYQIPEYLKHLNRFDVDHIDNLNPSCGVCNCWKSSFSLELFRSEIGEQVNRLKSRSGGYRLAKIFGLIEETNNKVVFYFETLK